MDPQHGLKLDLVLRGLWELLKSLNKGIPCYGLTRNFLVGLQVGPKVAAMLELVLGSIFEPTWEAFWSDLGMLLEAAWGRLGRVLMRLGGVLAVSWASGGVLGVPWWRFGGC